MSIRSPARARPWPCAARHGSCRWRSPWRWWLRCPGPGDRRARYGLGRAARRWVAAVWAVIRPASPTGPRAASATRRVARCGTAARTTLGSAQVRPRGRRSRAGGRREEELWAPVARESGGAADEGRKPPSEGFWACRGASKGGLVRAGHNAKSGLWRCRRTRMRGSWTVARESRGAEWGSTRGDLRGVWKEGARELRSGLGGRHEGGELVGEGSLPSTGAGCWALNRNGRLGAQRGAREEGRTL